MKEDTKNKGKNTKEKTAKKKREQNTNNSFDKYHSTAGLATKLWGPSGWNFLFSCIMGGYPPKINNHNKEHLVVKRHFKNMFKSLGYTMPCIFCRESYKGFLKESPIEPALVGRIELMRWLYDIRTKVNKKLMKQELECYNNEKKRLKKIYHSLPPTQNNKNEYYSNIQKFKEKTLITKPSPPFKEILDKYESLRAVCSNKAKTCALKEKK